MEHDTDLIMEIEDLRQRICDLEAERDEARAEIAMLEGLVAEAATIEARMSETISDVFDLITSALADASVETKHLVLDTLQGAVLGRAGPGAQTIDDWDRDLAV